MSKKRKRVSEEKMEKSSLNIKSFRNLLTSSQSRSYKISPNTYHPTEVKLNGLNGSLDESSNSRNIDDIYAVKLNKVDTARENECNRRNLADVLCGGFVRLVGNYNSSFCLTVLTPVACSVSVIIIVAAIAGPLWLQTEEKIPWLAVNSSYYRSNYTVSYIIKSSNASLWILCTRQALDDNRTKLDFTHKNCTKINYFAMSSYEPDPRDSTNESNNVIPYTITLSAPLLIISFIILLISYLLFLLAICSQKYKIFYFAAGIGFIISGLLSLSGLIMFISIFKSEVFHKMTETTSGKEPLYSFNYGQSFQLYVIGFVVVELSGILNVCLFNKLQSIAQQNQLNSYVKAGLMDSQASAANLCQHRVPFPSIVENGYLPQKRRCSLHSVPSNRKPANDGFHDLLSQPTPRFGEFNHHTLQTPFQRNASTSTLDLVGGGDGDVLSAKSNHRTINSAKDKPSVSNNFNNICGMMRSNPGKSKETNSSDNHRIGRLKPAKNVYYIEEQKNDEPSIFIIDPSTINKHKKFHQIQKSLEDIRIHKGNGTPAAQAYDSECDATIGWNFMDRNYYGSRTLPRDFARRNIRPGLDNLLNDAHQTPSEIDRHQMFDYNGCSHQSTNNLCPPPIGFHPPPNGFAFHHSSFDDILSTKPNRNSCHANGQVSFAVPPHTEYQWPKVIPKSPSSFSMNSFRLHRQPAFSKCPNYSPIDEFDLKKIELERRKSHATLFKENGSSTDFGTAV